MMKLTFYVVFNECYIPCVENGIMHFATSGQEALSIFEQSPQDILVIISDMRMPGMDGAQLLSEVMKNYPQTVRIIFVRTVRRRRNSSMCR